MDIKGLLLVLHINYKKGYEPCTTDAIVGLEWISAGYFCNDTKIYIRIHVIIGLYALYSYTSGL